MRVMAPKRPKKPAGKPEPPRPPRAGRNINVWVRADLGELLDAHLKRARPRPTLTTLVEAALEAYFQAHPLPPKEGGVP
jgi:hypothetical protein